MMEYVLFNGFNGSMDGEKQYIDLNQREFPLHGLSAVFPCYVTVLSIHNL